MLLEDTEVEGGSVPHFVILVKLRPVSWWVGGVWRVVCGGWCWLWCVMLVVVGGVGCGVWCWLWCVVLVVVCGVGCDVWLEGSEDADA